MASGKGRSYSDPSYGSKKIFSFTRVSLGTRSSATVPEAGVLTTIHPIKVVGWNIHCQGSADGGTAQFILCKGTTALGTLAFVTNPTDGTTISASITETALTAGDTLQLYAGTMESDATCFATARVEYRETFEDGDN